MNPAISVILPVLNSARTIGHQLEALAGQSYRGPWELIVADNGSTDRSQELARSWMDRIPWMRVVDASSRRGAAAARNIGAAAARADALAFCDSDDVVAPDWLESLDRALGEHEFVTGAIDHLSLNPGVTASWQQRTNVDCLPVALKFMPYALSGNMAVTREAFDKVGRFTEDLGNVGEDVDLSWKLQLAGYELHFEPAALVAYRHRQELRGLWRQQVQYGRAEAELFRRFKGYGLPPAQFRRTVRSYYFLLSRIPLLLSRRRRGKWLSNAAIRWGRIRGSVRGRVFYI
jgi:GT2 family glycosyltransferase